MRNYIIKLLYLLVLIYPWGRFFDKLFFSAGEQGAKGISTLVILLIVVLGIFSRDFASGAIKVQRKIFLLVFFALTLISTVLSDTPEKLSSDFINLVVYFLLIFVIVGTKPSFREITKIVKLLLFSTVLMALCSLLDYLNFISIPHFNKSISNVFVDDSFVFDLTGPFQIRTDLAYHIALISILPLLFIFLRKQILLSKVGYILMFMILVVTAYFSNTRSIFLSLVLSICYFIVLQIKSFKGIKFITALFFCAVILILATYNLQGESGLFLRDLGSQSDYTRLYAFKTTVYDVIKMPVGAGLGRPYIEEIRQYKDVHNSFTYLLRAGGFIGFISLLIFFFRPLLKKIFSFNILLSESIIILPILSLLIFGVFHTSIQVPTFWVLTGIAFSFHLEQKRYN